MIGLVAMCLTARSGDPGSVTLLQELSRLGIGKWHLRGTKTDAAKATKIQHILKPRRKSKLKKQKASKPTSTAKTKDTTNQIPGGDPQSKSLKNPEETQNQTNRFAGTAIVATMLFSFNACKNL